MLTQSTADYTTENEAGMPTSAAYLALLRTPHSTIREPHNSAFEYTERHLQCIWFDPRLRPHNLITSKGENISVLNPGRWNKEAGPDFLDAILLIGPEHRRIQGDVEIHIHPADWNHHKHADDPHFNKVAAHITYTPAAKPIKTLPPGTIEISLKKLLAAIPAFSFESIDITAYPYSTLPDSPRPCAIEMHKRTPEEIGTILEAAGAHRLRTKANRIKTKLKQNTPDQLIYSEILGALGYKQNTAVSRLLAETVPYQTISQLSPLKGYALLLGISGLIPEKPAPRWDNHTKTFIRKVWNAWWPQQNQWQNSLIPKNSWKLSSIRPQNHPIRRLAAAAALACNPNSPSEIIEKSFRQSAAAAQQTIADTFNAPDPIDYWHRHISLASKQRKKNIAIIGKARLSAININILLPYLAATGHNIRTIAENLPPEQSNTIIRQTAHAIFGRDHNPDLYSKSALRQQGLIQIFHDFCLTDRSACRNCPLPAALSRS